MSSSATEEDDELLGGLDKRYSYKGDKGKEEEEESEESPPDIKIERKRPAQQEPLVREKKQKGIQSFFTSKKPQSKANTLPLKEPLQEPSPEPEGYPDPPAVEDDAFMTMEAVPAKKKAKAKTKGEKEAMEPMYLPPEIELDELHPFYFMCKSNVMHKLLNTMQVLKDFKDSRVASDTCMISFKSDGFDIRVRLSGDIYSVLRGKKDFFTGYGVYFTDDDREDDDDPEKIAAVDWNWLHKAIKMASSQGQKNFYIVLQNIISEDGKGSSLRVSGVDAKTGEVIVTTERLCDAVDPPDTLEGEEEDQFAIDFSGRGPNKMATRLKAVVGTFKAFLCEIWVEKDKKGMLQMTMRCMDESSYSTKLTFKESTVDGMKWGSGAATTRRMIFPNTTVDVMSSIMNGATRAEIRIRKDGKGLYCLCQTQFGSIELTAAAMINNEDQL